MAGKQAKILKGAEVSALLRRVARGRYPERDRTMVLLSLKAGLRAGEIAKLSLGDGDRTRRHGGAGD